MNSFKHILFTGWNFMRFVRLGFGVGFIIRTIQTNDTLIGLVGAFFLFTAITNIGCCGSNGCTIPTQETKSHSSET